MWNLHSLDINTFRLYIDYSWNLIIVLQALLLYLLKYNLLSKQEDNRIISKSWVDIFPLQWDAEYVNEQIISLRTKRNNGIKWNVSTKSRGIQKDDDIHLHIIISLHLFRERRVQKVTSQTLFSLVCKETCVM